MNIYVWRLRSEKERFDALLAELRGLMPDARFFVNAVCPEYIELGADFVLLSDAWATENDLGCIEMGGVAAHGIAVANNIPWTTAGDRSASTLARVIGSHRPANCNCYERLRKVSFETARLALPASVNDLKRLVSFLDDHPKNGSDIAFGKLMELGNLAVAMACDRLETAWRKGDAFQKEEESHDR